MSLSSDDENANNRQTCDVYSTEVHSQRVFKETDENQGDLIPVLVKIKDYNGVDSAFNLVPPNIKSHFQVLECLQRLFELLPVKSCMNALRKLCKQKSTNRKYIDWLSTKFHILETHNIEFLLNSKNNFKKSIKIVTKYFKEHQLHANLANLIDDIEEEDESIKGVLEEICDTWGLENCRISQIKDDGNCMFNFMVKQCCGIQHEGYVRAFKLLHAKYLYSNKRLFKNVIKKGGLMLRINDEDREVQDFETYLYYTLRMYSFGNSLTLFVNCKLTNYNIICYMLDEIHYFDLQQDHIVCVEKEKVSVYDCQNLVNKTINCDVNTIRQELYEKYHGKSIEVVRSCHCATIHYNYVFDSCSRDHF